MKQTIEFRKTGNLFILYRCPFNEKEKRGIDNYNRVGFQWELNNNDEPFNPFLKISGGAVLVPSIDFSKQPKSKEDLANFLGIDQSKDGFVEVNLWACFAYNKIIIFKDGVQMPKRVIKTTKNMTKDYKRWSYTCGSVDYNATSYTTKMWKFKNETDYFILSYSDYLFWNIYPLLAEEIFREKSKIPSPSFEDIQNRLFNVDPINLSIVNYDYTDEQKKYIKECEIEKNNKHLKYLEELDVRKRTPGFCSCCGKEYASYVADPYIEEMYGETSMTWLCDECYHDFCMDV